MHTTRTPCTSTEKLRPVWSRQSLPPGPACDTASVIPGASSTVAAYPDPGGTEAIRRSIDRPIDQVNKTLLGTI